jgi:hypothetical protein
MGVPDASIVFSESSPDGLSTCHAETANEILDIGGDDAIIITVDLNPFNRSYR